MSSVSRTALGPCLALWACLLPTVAPAAGQPPEPCWRSDQLQARPGEQRRRKLWRPEPGAQDAALLRELDRRQTAAPAITKGSIRSVQVKGKEKPIALTFDLCEQADEVSGYDGAIIDYLRANQIKATFYAGGKWMHSHRERSLQLMADPRFEIGNHAWTHGNLRVLEGQAMRDQIVWTQAQYYRLRQELEGMSCLSASAKRAIPWQPASFRFPYGTCSQEALDAVAELGLSAVQWSIVTGDPASQQSAQAIANTVLREARPGAIIVAHANGRGRHTAESLPLFIPELQARGYEFVTVSELLARGQPQATTTCYELREGDNKRYDRLFGAGTGR